MASGTMTWVVRGSARHVILGSDTATWPGHARRPGHVRFMSRAPLARRVCSTCMLPAIGMYNKLLACVAIGSRALLSYESRSLCGLAIPRASHATQL